MAKGLCAVPLDLQSTTVSSLGILLLPIKIKILPYLWVPSSMRMVNPAGLKEESKVWKREYWSNIHTVNVTYCPSGCISSELLTLYNINVMNDSHMF